MPVSILVVENHPDLRAEIVATLNREQYQCDAVGTGDAALLKLRDNNYRYILLDVDAATAGAALFQSLASDPNSLEKLILITDSDDTLGLRGPAAQCAKLCKPFDTKQLLARIQR